MTSQATQTRPTIVLACLNGFSVRYFLRTEILARLLERGARCVVLFGGADDPEFVKEFSRPGVVIETLRNKAYRDYEHRRPLVRFLKRLRRFTLNGQYDTSTVDTFLRLERARAHGFKATLVGAAVATGVAILKRSSTLRRWLVAFESARYTPDIHKDTFAAVKPDLLVVSTLGYLDYDDYLMREAARAGVPVTAAILSWDNTSSKGIGGARADRVITWTENMTNEVVTFHDYPANRVHVGGVAHFDEYADRARMLSRDVFIREFGLDPDRRTIFFAAKSPSAYPWNPDIIEMIAEAIEADRFAVPCQLVARVHPAQFVKKHAVLDSQRSLQAVNWDRYQAIAAKFAHVHFSVPALRVGSAFDIDRRENLILGSLLCHSDVVVNCFSTINLEAAIFDKPIVNVAFNGPGASPTGNPRHDLRIDERQFHNQRVVQTGAVRLARDPNQLIGEINRYLIEPTLDADARRALVTQECGGYLGSAGRRIGDLIFSEATRQT